MTFSAVCVSLGGRSKFFVFIWSWNSEGKSKENVEGRKDFNGIGNGKHKDLEGQERSKLL